MSEQELLDAANELRGNWKKFDSFAWRWEDNGITDPDEWGIVYTSTRDSRPREESNADAIRQAMEPFLAAENPDIKDEDHNHWACGWVKGFSIRPLRDGEPTEAFKAFHALKRRVDRGEILDWESYMVLLMEEDFNLLRDVNVDGYRLQLWDTGEPLREGMPQHGVVVRFLEPDGTVLFEHREGCSPMVAIDSDDMLQSAMTSVTMREGDVDSDWFDNYTEAQLEFRDTMAEELSIWASDPEEGKLKWVPWDPDEDEDDE